MAYSTYFWTEEVNNLAGNNNQKIKRTKKKKRNFAKIKKELYEKGLVVNKSLGTVLTLVKLDFSIS